jgi:hypothetical protein
MGETPIAKELHEKSRNMLFQVFDEVETDYDVAVCYSYLAVYNVYQGECKRANFYMKNCNKYLQRNNQSTPYSNFLRFIIQTCTLLMDEQTDLLGAFQHMCLLHGLLGRFRAMDLRDKETQITQGEDYIDMVVAEFTEQMQENTKLIPQRNLEVKRQLFFMLAIALKLQIQASSGKPLDLQMMQMADTITDLTVTENFGHMAPVIVFAVMEATATHMRFLLAEYSDYVIMKLKLDLRALRLLSGRYPLFAPRYGSYIETLASVITLQEQKHVQKIDYSGFLQLNEF